MYMKGKINGSVVGDDHLRGSITRWNAPGELEQHAACQSSSQEIGYTGLLCEAGAVRRMIPSKRYRTRPVARCDFVRDSEH
jgi:hypothetical protein